VIGGSSSSAPKASSGGGSTSATSSSASVSMAGRAFSPGSVTIAAGGTVTFRNDDDRAHTVTANDGAFNSGPIGEGGSWKRTFKQAGTFSYLCAIHPEMTGEVVVKGSSGSAGSAAAPANTPKPKPTPTPTPTSKPATESAEAQIRDFAFAPATLSVPVGSTVTWQNTGEAPHTVTADDGSFDSDMIAAGGSWARTFDAVGTYRYVCAFHPGMEGVVEVTASEVVAPSGSPTPAVVAPAVVAPAATQTPPATQPSPATQPPAATNPNSEPTAVSTQGPSFGGELMARVAIVGLLIGGAFLLFARAVRGSANRAIGG
jgi:plastocyanin